MIDWLIELERYTRGFNLRFYNFEEETVPNQKEDCCAKLLDKLASVGLTNIRIENAHRVGASKPPGPGVKARAIIARFNDRPDKKLVLNKRSALFTAGCPVYEDLCQRDLKLKSQHAEVMKELYRQNHKTYFSRGNWFVDGRVYKPNGH